MTAGQIVRSTVLVLAGRRPGPPDAMEAAEAVAHKAFIDIGGIPMIGRVFRTLDRLDAAGDIIVAAPRETHAAIAALAAEKKPCFVDASATPATTVHDALARSEGSLLVTTSDHPLLTPAMAESFIAEIGADGIDAAAACVDAKIYRAAYPNTRRTFIRLSDMTISGANLFWFRKDAAEPLLMFWRALEARRKRPAAMAAQIGWGPLLLYALGRLSSAGLTHAVARRTGVRARLVALPFAEAAIDVDTPADLALVRRIFSERR